jgi:hypothetical protein
MLKTIRISHALLKSSPQRNSNLIRIHRHRSTMAALISGDTFFLDNFAIRQWEDPDFAGTSRFGVLFLQPSSESRFQPPNFAGPTKDDHSVRLQEHACHVTKSSLSSGSMRFSKLKVGCWSMVMPPFANTSLFQTNGAAK